MSIIKKIILILPIFILGYFGQLSSEEIKKIGKYKDWEVMAVTEASGKFVLLNHHLYYKLQNQTREMQNYLLLLGLQKK